MSTTPKLPEWIKKIRVEGYRSVYEYCPDETRLFGTESLFGDWNGRVLLLAQDFAPSSEIEKRLGDWDHPYSHDPFARTNTRITEYASQMITDNRSSSCGVLYGSAFAFLLRDDGLMRGQLPNEQAATWLGARVLEWTVENMPNLEIILCLGNIAWKTTSKAIDIPKDRKPYLESGNPALARGIRVFAAWHPTASEFKTKTVIPWENAARLLAA